MNAPDCSDVTREVKSLLVNRILPTGRQVQDATKNILEGVHDVAVAFADMKNKEMAKDIEQEFRGILELKHDLEVFHETLVDMEQSYEGSLDPTDFGSLIESGMAQKKQTGFNVQDTFEYKELYRELARGGVGGDGQQMHATDNEDNDDFDDDLQIMDDSDQLAPNAKCPLTSVDIMDLNEPVEDTHGIVYEKFNIEQYIQSSGVGHEVMCPVAGTNHRVKLQDLRQARRVIREQNRRKRRTAAANAYVGDSMEDEVL